nr:zinc finger, CCHC-type [Tanacetum cinerariifolium]
MSLSISLSFDISSSSATTEGCHRVCDRKQSSALDSTLQVSQTFVILVVVESDCFIDMSPLVCVTSIPRYLYGYVYLLKHKHEVFENFKVFKSEVELQLGKKIKALRSDRGGEYLSQEFKDYLSKAPNLSYLKVWGCEVYVKGDSADKLHQRSVKCIFVGYPKETIGYYFYFPPENKVIVARYENFFERDLISQKFIGRDNDLEDDYMDTFVGENTTD